MEITIRSDALVHAKYFNNFFFLLVEFMGLKLAYMSTQTQLIHGLHMDVIKTVDNINISIKHYNGFVIHVRLRRYVS